MAMQWKTNPMRLKGERTMKRPRLLWVAMAIAGVALTLTSASAVAQGGETGVTGAAEAALPDGARFNGVSLTGLEVGTGAFIDSDGTAIGQVFAVLHGTLLGRSRDIDVDSRVTSGSVGSDGSATLRGVATVDMGDGTVLRGVPFTATATANSLLLTLGTSALPSAALTAGTITID
jgi:hypothetical protein